MTTTALMNLWKKFSITLTVRNRLVGGIPTNPDLIKGWVQANMKSATEEEKTRVAEATMSELPQIVEERAEKTWTTFKRDTDGIYFEGRNMKAMFKECSNILRELLIKNDKKAKTEGAEKKSKFTNLKSRVAERAFVEEDKIRLVRAGAALKEPDGAEERAIHVMGAQGPRTALKRTDYVEGPFTLTFTLRVLDDGLVDEALIRTLLDFGGYNGLGTDRAMGNGLFELTELKAL